jgi:hypothetical protein
MADSAIEIKRKIEKAYGDMIENLFYFKGQGRVWA